MIVAEHLKGALMRHRDRVLVILNTLSSDLAVIALSLNLMALPSGEEWRTWTQDRARITSIRALIQVDPIFPSKRAIDLYGSFVQRARAILEKEK